MGGCQVKCECSGLLPCLVFVAVFVLFPLGIRNAVLYHKTNDFIDGNCTILNSTFYIKKVRCDCLLCKRKTKTCSQIFVGIDDNGATRRLQLYESEDDIGNECFLEPCDTTSASDVDKIYPIGKTFACSYHSDKDEAVVNKEIPRSRVLHLMIWPSVFLVLLMLTCIVAFNLDRCKRNCVPCCDPLCQWL
ncbi:uncharacterized protein LOC117120853 isoform X2 [Anneissia japonica]|uniref:uncharacterized protein LOC117120853 isoform X2 n=1 Tax=Anneissia japonica TaxID=1529436 RepID=UPI0014259A28|nr:uncharacterized protein LOC117120853 isoform X2 [Anneissia japonica]